MNELFVGSVYTYGNCDLEIDAVFTLDIIHSDHPEIDGCNDQHTYTWFAIDACGNVDSVSFTVNLMNNLPPVVGLPGDTIIRCSPLPIPGDMVDLDSSQIEYVTF